MWGTPQCRHGPYEPGPLQLPKDILDRFRWVLMRASDLLDAGPHHPVIDVDLVQDKVVGVFRFDVPGRQILHGEILVRGDDDLSAGLDRRSQYVAIVRVPQIQSLNQRFMPDTRQSATASTISSRVRPIFSGRMSGRLFCTAANASSRMRSVQLRLDEAC